MQSIEAETEKAALQARLAMHTGSQVWYRHWSGHLIYTEGVQDLAASARAYWLVDLVASWCPHPSVKDEPFVVWKLRNVSTTLRH